MTLDEQNNSFNKYASSLFSIAQKNLISRRNSFDLQLSISPFYVKSAWWDEKLCTFYSREGFSFNFLMSSFLQKLYPLLDEALYRRPKDWKLDFTVEN